MNFFEILLTAISLSLDAVAVSVAAGALRQLTSRQIFNIAFFFGGFQFAMPLIGWALGLTFVHSVSKYGNIIGFIALASLGSKMLYESLKTNDKEEIEEDRNITNLKVLSILALSTSIDALVVGITFNFVRVNVLFASSIIGIVTLLLCAIGVLIGKKGRDLIGNRIEAIGATILILLAFKILLF